MVTRNRERSGKVPLYRSVRALVFGGVVAIVGIVLLWRSFAATPASADLNGDGIVNLSDLSILMSNFGKTEANIKGDINADGTVNLADLSMLLSNYGKSPDPDPGPTPPPADEYGKTIDAPYQVQTWTGGNSVAVVWAP